MHPLRSHWPQKDPGEALIAEFDFVDELATGETIGSLAVSCSVLAGSDASPSAVLNGSPTISGGLVLQPFHGGLDGVTYLLRCVATLSSGRILVRTATLPVRSA